VDVESRNPATGELVLAVPAATDEQVADAVGRAGQAWPSWAARPVGERAAVLWPSRRWWSRTSRGSPR
jgi:acyl-CoA reductase-like NAD-dependent aldehyde dehydrogenase